MEELIKKHDNLNTKEDFVSFVELLLQDLKSNPGEWENKSLESYLGAIASWTEDSDGYYTNMNLPIPQNVDWKVFANILIAAKMYE
jgi:hypothetical protein